MPVTPGGLPSKVIKVLVVGGPETGKTCLLQSYNGAGFDDMYTPTLKSDLVVKEMKIGTFDVSAQMWDIGGSSPMGKSFLRGTHAVLLVVDLTSCGSMDGLDATYERVRGLAGFADDSFPCALVGNKLDLVSPTGDAGQHPNHGSREVTMDDLRLWAKARRPSNPDSISFYEASARDGTNVAEIFESLVCLAFTQPAKHLHTPAPSAQGGGSIYGGSDYSSASRSPPGLSTLDGKLTSPRGEPRAFGQTPNNPNLSYLAGIVESSSRGPPERRGPDDELATAKVIIAGSPRVGKTCILRRFVGDDTLESLER